MPEDMLRLAAKMAYGKDAAEIYSFKNAPLLLTFINNRGQVLTRAGLLQDMWDVDGDFVNDNTLTVYIKCLRDKIEENPSEPKIIKTVRGMGYITDR